MKLLPFLFLLTIIISCNHSSPVKNNSKESAGWALLPFTKADEANPVLVPDSSVVFDCPVNGKVKWEEKDVFNPAAVIRHDTLFLLYRAEDKVGRYAGTSRIGLAWSTDGLHFNKHPVPVLYPDRDSLLKYEWEGGCEDPRIVESENGTYYMTYTAYDGDKARLMIASSTDLYHWKKHGRAFLPGLAEWSKSGAIVSDYSSGTPVATKINGRYWMYWGDTHIFAAVSEDLVNWEVVVGDTNSLLSFISPRAGKFDSDLVEPGPPAIIRDSGILLLYNSRNIRAKGDTTLPEGTYTTSQILFDKEDPGKILHRMDTFFMKPEKPYEISGQVNNVCFIEGLVNYKGKWLLYYGTADSKIAVATK